MLKDVFFPSLCSWPQHIFLQEVWRTAWDSLEICPITSVKTCNMPPHPLHPLPFICSVRLKPKSLNSYSLALPSAYLLMVVHQPTWALLPSQPVARIGVKMKGSGQALLCYYIVLRIHSWPVDLHPPERVRPLPGCSQWGQLTYKFLCSAVGLQQCQNRTVLCRHTESQAKIWCGHMVSPSSLSVCWF